MQLWCIAQAEAAAGALAQAQAAHAAAIQQLTGIHDAALQAVREEASGLHTEVCMMFSTPLRDQLADE